ncbi:MAG: amino acid ABC transporter permease [Rhodospirillales bacterium]|nr:amino acid ABC transporter permease [Rhodospirillales bacterium]
MNKWEILWNHREMILDGFKGTLILFVVSVTAAFLLSSMVVLAIQTNRGPLGRVVRGVVDGMRMLPFLIYAYILYYGLPSLGIRLDAWTAGFIALITYHAAYFAEILRGTWATLSTGQAEAARAHGFTKFAMYRRILLPQLVLRSAPVLGNQTIICLKDTAFLSIITVRELTAAASAVQSQYFIPFEAFIVAIGLYWLTSILIEALVARIGFVAEGRGLGYTHAVVRR